MRFLCTDLFNGFPRLKEIDHRIPNSDRVPEERYAILSHRWGEHEVLLEHLLAQDPFFKPVRIADENKPSLHRTVIGGGVRKSKNPSQEIGRPRQSRPETLRRSSRLKGNSEKHIRDNFQTFLRNWCRLEFQDWNRFKKLVGCCWRAAQDGYNYIWIDSCCIDQKSSSELSESINSMFLLYTNSDHCYAYLEDVNCSANPMAPQSDFRRSEWFNRGWTLQELIAPPDVQFLNRTWEAIGSKNELAFTIEEITGINYGVLCGFSRVQGGSSGNHEDRRPCVFTTRDFRYSYDNYLW